MSARRARNDLGPGAGDDGALARDAGAFDQLATLIAVVDPNGRCLHANAALEQCLEVARRALKRGRINDWFVDPLLLGETLRMLAANEVASSRFEAVLRRPRGGAGLPVQVIVSQTDWAGCAAVEMIEIEQHSRQDREQRAQEQAQATTELLRNLAHEIRNPLGGIRGAAQLLALELQQRPELDEYTRVIIDEADRLRALVDRLLAPQQRPQDIVDVNIHEVCERVAKLVLAEHPRGLALRRDYDASIPGFRGDREQLIQAVLNVARNAAQALGERIAAGAGAEIVLRTRIARQATIARQRYRLALELQVEDNGPGVADHLRERIFQPLVTGRDGGVGLGLMLAQTFVQRHDGSIACESSPGRTVFKIMIPLP